MLLGGQVSNLGIIQAETLNNRNSKIILDGGQQGVVRLNGTLDASSFSGASGNVVVTLL